MKELNIYINDNDLKQIYLTKAKEHNTKIDNSNFMDSGFDILTPNKISICYGKTHKIDFGIICSMYESNIPFGYYMYPRSSISKTRLRLANNVGIIDSGYRGNLLGYFDCLPHPSIDQQEFVIYDYNSDHIIDYNIDKYQRLLQICSNDLKPFKINIVDNIEDLDNPNLGVSERGDKGIGSTGK